MRILFFIISFTYLLSHNAIAQRPDHFTQMILHIPSFNQQADQIIFNDHKDHEITFLQAINFNAIYPTNNLNLHPVQIWLPVYTQGAFCNFEDHINRHRKLRIDFGVK